jgi:hypothetical protein
MTHALAAWQFRCSLHARHSSPPPAPPPLPQALPLGCWSQRRFCITCEQAVATTRVGSCGHHACTRDPSGRAVRCKSLQLLPILCATVSLAHDDLQGLWTPLLNSAQLQLLRQFTKTLCIKFVAGTWGGCGRQCPLPWSAAAPGPDPPAAPLSGPCLPSDKSRHLDHRAVEPPNHNCSASWSLNSAQVDGHQVLVPMPDCRQCCQER